VSDLFDELEDFDAGPLPDMRRAKLIDLTGKQFGRLFVVGRGKMKSTWLCICDCGERREVLSTVLRRGRQVSCGCYQRQMNRRAMIGRLAREKR
jgi:hypothetical protein